MHVCVHVPNKQLRGQLASSKFLKRKATQLSTKDNCVQIWGHCSTKRLTFKVVCPSSAARTTKELLDAPFDTWSRSYLEKHPPNQAGSVAVLHPKLVSALWWVLKTAQRFLPSDILQNHTFSCQHGSIKKNVNDSSLAPKLDTQMIQSYSNTKVTHRLIHSYSKRQR